MYDNDEDFDLQNDQAEEYEDDSEQFDEDQDQQLGSDSEPDSEPEHEENAEGDEVNSKRQEAIDAAIAKQHAKYREEQRRAQQLEAENRQLREYYDSQADPEPQIFEIDPYGDDIEDQIKQRDESHRAHYEWQQRQAYRRQQQQSQLTYSQQMQAQEAQKKAEDFFNRAKRDGIKQDVLTQAVNAVGQFGLGREVADYLMDDEKGHAVTVALAKNPAVLAELASMPVHQRILHIERNVRSKVANSRPRRSQGSRPPKRVESGGNKASKRFPLTSGRVTIE